MQNIIYLDPKEIENHPDNPRKNIGDVTELSESIKRDGIRQNLTVIPYEQGYRCLIGHRRLAAAKLVGLERIPCIVEKDTLTRNEQIAIMLAENMQRADLTPIEEAAMAMITDEGKRREYDAEWSDKRSSFNSIDTYARQLAKVFLREGEN